MAKSVKSRSVAAPRKPAKKKSPPASAAATAKPARKGVGRPPRLSREMIIEASLKLLREYAVDGFTLARVAERLDTVSMALYNYFPSREALLAELANHISKQFTMPPPKPGQGWKKTLRDWLWTLRELGEKYPVIFRISGVDGKTSAGWLRITRIPGITLRELGFEGKDLALLNWLLCMQAHALIQAEVTDAGFHSGVSLSPLEELEPEEQTHFLMLRSSHAKVSGDDVMEAGFADIIANIERKLPKKKAPRSRSAKV